MVVIFDFDGTIANSLPIAVGILNKLSSSFGYEKIEEDDVEKLRNMTISDFRVFLQLSWMQVPLFLLRAREELFNQVSLLKPVFGMEDVLSELRHKNITLGVITSNSAQVVETFTRQYFSDYFSFVHAGTSIFGKDKILKDVINKFHLDEREVIYIGDEVRDIDAAKKAGVRIVSVTWGFQSKELLVKSDPDFIIEQPHDLFSILT